MTNVPPQNTRAPLLPPTLPEEPTAIIPHDEPLRTAPPPAKRSNLGCGCRGCLYVIGALFAVFVVLVIAVVVLMIALPGTVGGAVSNVAQSVAARIVPTTSANVISTTTIVTGIQPLGQLVSVSSQFARADVQVSISQGALNACGYSANHVVQGTVAAGIDLTHINAGSLSYDAARDTYILTVPEPELTSCSVDFIRQYERSFTACTSVDWDEARLLASYLSLIDFRNTAIEGGILTRAETETRLVLGNFVRLLTGHPVDIVFAPSINANGTPEPTAFPPTCSPDVPAGWTQNSDGSWNRTQ